MRAIDYIVITEPTVEPVTVAELREHCNITTSTLNDYLEALGKAARAYVEWRTGRTLYQTTLEAVFDDFPCSSERVSLPRASPLQSVTSVIYKDSDGTPTTWGASNYIVDTDRQPGFIVPAYGIYWPVFTPYPTGAVRVRYVAGLNPSASPLVEPPEGLKHAIKLLVGGMFEYRESEIVPDKPGIQSISLQYGVEALLAQYRVDYPF